MGLGIEGNHEVVQAFLSDVDDPVVVVTHGVLVNSIVVVADNLETEVAGQCNAVSGPGIETCLGVEHHVIVGVVHIPIGAEYGLGTNNGVRSDLHYRRLLGVHLGGNAVDLLGLGVEGDHEVVHAFLGDVHDPVVVVTLGPAVVPIVVADNLEAEVAGQGNTVSHPGIETCLGVEHHVVVGVGRIPVGAEYGLRTSNGEDGESGLRLNGVGGPGAENDELVVLEVKTETPGALRQSDGIVAAIGGQVAFNSKKILGHHEITVAHGTETVGSYVVPRSLTFGIGKFLGEADVSQLLTFAGGRIHIKLISNTLKSFREYKFHLCTLGGIPAFSGAEVVHVTEDVDIIIHGLRSLLCQNNVVVAQVYLDVVGTGKNLKGASASPVCEHSFNAVLNEGAVGLCSAAIAGETPVIGGLAELAGEAEEAEAVATVGDLSTGECEGVLVGGSHLDTSRRIPVVAVHLAQDK